MTHHQFNITMSLPQALAVVEALPDHEGLLELVLEKFAPVEVGALLAHRDSVDPDGFYRDGDPGSGLFRVTAEVVDVALSDGRFVVTAENRDEVLEFPWSQDMVEVEPVSGQRGVYQPVGGVAE